jgi:transposase
MLTGSGCSRFGTSSSSSTARWPCSRARSSISWPITLCYQAIQQIPGVGPLFAAVFTAEIGDVTRFRTPAQLASWAGLTPKHRESDTTVHRGSITKQGSRLVRWAAVEAAQRQANGTKLRADFTRITAHHGDTAGARRIARVAVARKIVTLVYYGLRDGTIRSRAVEAAA